MADHNILAIQKVPERYVFLPLRTASSPGHTTINQCVPSNRKSSVYDLASLCIVKEMQHQECTLLYPAQFHVMTHLEKSSVITDTECSTVFVYHILLRMPHWQAFRLFVNRLLQLKIMQQGGFFCMCLYTTWVSTFAQIQLLEVQFLKNYVC